MTDAERSASQPRHEVETRLGVRIPVRDGLELSANLWLPVARPDGPAERFPAILEMIPYGKDSWRRNADVARGEWLARRGFALCRLDVRGTGSSPGTALDEYTADETRDGYDAVEWLAGQAWCNGNIGMWGISYGGFSAIQARDLRPDEASVPTYTSDPLPEPVSILGLPSVVLRVAASAQVATVVVRLADVAPDGTSALVSAGVLNLTYRRSHTEPLPLEPGRVEEVRVPIRAAGYRWLAGHRIRLSIGSGSWPTLWPSPHPVELAVHHGPATPSRLVLPVVPPAGGAGDVEPPAFRSAPPDEPAVGESDEDAPTWRIVDDVVDGSTTVHVHDGGTEVLADGRRLYAAETIAMTARDADPACTDLAADVVYRWHEHSFETEIRARSRQSSTSDAFELSVDLEVDVDGEPFFARRWSESIPRRLV